MYIRSQQQHPASRPMMGLASIRHSQTRCVFPSLRSCRLPIIPLCLSREDGVIFFPSRAKETKKQKKKKKRLISGYVFPA